MTALIHGFSVISTTFFSLVQFQTDFEAGTSYSCALISCLLEDSGVFGGGRPLFRPFLFTLSRCRL